MIVTYVRWASAPPYTIRRYEFRTLAEHEAFVAGVDEACGWMDYRFIEAGECVRCGHARDVHRDGDACVPANEACGCTRFETYVSYERPQSGDERRREFVAALEEALGGMGFPSCRTDSAGGGATLLVEGGEAGELLRITIERARAVRER